jgi:hypothetical protein
LAHGAQPGRANVSRWPLQQLDEAIGDVSMEDCCANVGIGCGESSGFDHVAKRGKVRIRVRDCAGLRLNGEEPKPCAKEAHVDATFFRLVPQRRRGVLVKLEQAHGLRGMLGSTRIIFLFAFFLARSICRLPAAVRAEFGVLAHRTEFRAAALTGALSHFHSISCLIFDDRVGEPGKRGGIADVSSLDHLRQPTIDRCPRGWMQAG